MKGVMQVLGVPTRSDAAVLDPEYAEAVAAAELSEKLGRFEGVFSTVYPHNHVAEAYRDSGNVERLTYELRRFRKIWDISPGRVPKAAAKLLKPDLVRDYYLNAIRSFRQTLEEVRPVLDCETSVVIQNFEHKPYPNLHDSVVVEECVVDYVYEGDALVRREGEGRGWKYSFNLYELANAILDVFEQAVISLHELERTSIQKIAAMMWVAHCTTQEPSFKLVEDSLQLGEGSSPLSYEYDEEHPVHALVVQNRQIGEKSDLWLRFDELYFIVGHGAQIPANGVLETENRMAYYTLDKRVMLRQMIAQAILERGHVTINGVVYEKATVCFGGETHEGYIATGPAYQQLVNLLGKPVQQPDGILVEPEAWAKEEVELVEAFVDGRDPAATEELLERYNLDTSSGNPSREKMLEQLAYSCGTLDF